MPFNRDKLQSFYKFLVFYFGSSNLLFSIKLGDSIMYTLWRWPFEYYNFSLSELVFTSTTLIKVVRPCFTKINRSRFESKFIFLYLEKVEKKLFRWRFVMSYSNLNQKVSQKNTVFSHIAKLIRNVYTTSIFFLLKHVYFVIFSARPFPFPGGCNESLRLLSSTLLP